MVILTKLLLLLSSEGGTKCTVGPVPFPVVEFEQVAPAERRMFDSTVKIKKLTPPAPIF